MPLNCPLCNRVNPDEALFCCHDGAALGGGSRPVGPVAVGAQPFGSAFVFPTGRFCRTFDELVLACEAHWDEARDPARGSAGRLSQRSGANRPVLGGAAPPPTRTRTSASTNCSAGCPARCASRPGCPCSRPRSTPAGSPAAPTTDSLFAF